MSTAIPMTPDERKRFFEMEAQVRSIYNVIVGDPMDKQPGIAERLTIVEKKQALQDAKINRLTLIAIGFGLGILVGGLVFGFISWDTFSKALKLIK